MYFFNTEDWERHCRSCRAVVILYKNKGLFKGNHFISGVRKEEKFVFYNTGLLPRDTAVTMDEALLRLKKAGNFPWVLIVV